MSVSSFRYSKFEANREISATAQTVISVACPNILHLNRSMYSSVALCFFLHLFLFHSSLSHFIIFVLQLHYFQAISVALFIYKSKCIGLQWPVSEPNNVRTTVWNAWILTTCSWSSAANGRLSKLLTFVIHVFGGQKGSQSFRAHGPTYHALWMRKWMRWKYTFSVLSSRLILIVLHVSTLFV